MELKHTPLYERHVAAGGKLIDFNSWELPVEYAGILAEHDFVRKNAGLFDVSHMGEIRVSGAKALHFVNQLVTNDISRAAAGQVVYSPMCHRSGGTVDDLLVYKISDEEFFLVVNAANKDKDFIHIKDEAPEGIEVIDESQQWAQIALQGPKAIGIALGIAEQELSAIRPFRFIDHMEMAKKDCLVSRTGYTGEDGLEIYCRPEDAAAVWDAILSIGGKDVMPIGLGARDTLRFEAKLPLYGHELADEITPLEAGLGRFVKLDKPEGFLGIEKLKTQQEAGLQRILCEIEIIGRGIPRPGYEVRVQGEKAGYVTSGGVCPALGKTMALAMLDAKFAQTETELELIVRDKPLAAVVRENAFYKRR